MGTAIDKPAILKLSVEERLKLIELIWETIKDSGMPLGPDLAELNRRLDDARANPDDGMTIEEFELRLRSRRA